MDAASQLRAALTGKVSEAHVDTASKTIIEAYATGDRCWHTLEAHILPGLRSLNFIADLAKINDPQERAALALGWIGHDCVYHAKQNDNEEQSADTMGRLLRKCGVPEDTIDTVKRLILVTKKHHGTRVDENIIIFCDLEILRAPLPHYKKYAQGIYREYQCFGEASLSAGRKHWIEKMLAAPEIFPRIWPDNAWATKDENAKKNLSAELEGLKTYGLAWVEES